VPSNGKGATVLHAVLTAAPSRYGGIIIMHLSSLKKSSTQEDKQQKQQQTLTKQTGIQTS